MVTLRSGLLALCLVLGPVTSLVSGSTTGCLFTECTCEDTIIDCRGKGLDQIPPIHTIQAGHFTDLLLQDNNLTVILEDTLPHGMDTIDFSDNPITDINPLAFRYSAQTLKIVRFRGAKFDTLPAALEALDGLETLDIEDVPLTTFPTTVLTKLSRSLSELRLASVGISGFPTWLSSLLFLRKLDLSNNRVGNIAATGLEPWADTLTDLTLTGTETSDIACVGALGKLERLDLSNNRISDSVKLTYHLIPSLNTLKYVDFSTNRMTSLPRLMMLTHLTEANFNANKLTTDNSGAFPPSLLTLSLDNNKFTSVPSSVKSLLHLKTLSMSNNAIKRLSSHSFPKNSRLIELSLSGSVLEDIDGHAFDDTRQLTYLNMDGTSLSRMPMALGVLTKLADLWMPGNTKLECTCDEKDLASLISSSSLKVIGECGLLAIKTYFTDLVQHCP